MRRVMLDYAVRTGARTARHTPIRTSQRLPMTAARHPGA